jgi:hypothetical protein
MLNIADASVISMISASLKRRRVVSHSALSLYQIGCAAEQQIRTLDNALGGALSLVVRNGK